MRYFGEYVEKSGQTLIKGKVDCLQMNLGYACNLSCSHCHVEAGPHRREKMSREVIDDCLRFAGQTGVTVVDITGGAPELNPHLRYLIKNLRELSSVKNILLRSNLCILEEPEYSDLPEFLLKNNVDIVASMPCYLEENVNRQRGSGVYEKNIRIMQNLNSLGFGFQGPKLHLVYNPGGDFLPGPQPMLEAAYKESLKESFGITFNNLYTVTNMPIGRFRDDLEEQGQLEAYRQLLSDNFNAYNLDKVMCRNLISVDWQGRVYDCDFNHVLHMPVCVPDNYIGKIALDDLSGAPISFGQHCFACVAGSGSSCQGSLSQIPA
jgi:radical SAM/Cys-rich protein